MTDSPFSDLRGVLSQLPDADTCAAKKVLPEITAKSSPDGNELTSLKGWLAIWQGSSDPCVDEAHICVLASAYDGHDASLATDFIAAASKGRAPVNRLCVDRGVGLRVLELAPEMPHDRDKKWSEAECMAAVAFGMEATAAGGHLLGVSEIAPGNVPGSIAILASVLGSDANKQLEAWSAEIGSASQDQIELAKTLISSVEYTPTSALDALLAYGGREIAANVGAIVAARSRRLPVVLDGWSGLAALAILEAEQSGSTDHVRISSCQDEVALKVVETMGKTPLLGVVVDSGPGCGNAISVALLKAACDL